MKGINLANSFSILRIFFIPFFITAIAYYKPGRENLRLWALTIFSLAIATDLIDGYIARHRGEKTKLGSILDPLADKLLLTSAFICLSLNSNLLIRLPLYVPIVVISRDAILILGAVVICLVTEEIEVKPSRWGKLTTFLQMSTVIAVLIQFPFTWIFWSLMIPFTVVSGLDYVLKGMKLFDNPR